MHWSSERRPLQITGTVDRLAAADHDLGSGIGLVQSWLDQIRSSPDVDLDHQGLGETSKVQAGWVPGQGDRMMIGPPAQARGTDGQRR